MIDTKKLLILPALMHGNYTPNFSKWIKGTGKWDLTYGAVGSCPVGLTDAGTRFCVEGAVAGALLWTSALQDFTVDSTPAWVTVAFTVVTGTMAGAGRVHAVHWGHRTRRKSVLGCNLKTNKSNLQTAQQTAEIKYLELPFK